MRAKRLLEVLALVALVASIAAFAVLERRASGPPTAVAPTSQASLPTTTPRTGPDPSAIAVVGDSLSLQAGGPEEEALTAAGWQTVVLDVQMGRRINVESSRPPTSGISAVRAIRATHRDPLTWVIELGTNDAPMIGDDAAALKRAIESMLDEIGSGHRVVWVNVYHAPRPVAAATVDRVLDELALEEHGIVVADWAARAWRDGYLLPDGVHLTAMGTLAYASMVADAARRTGQLPLYFAP
jgi:lysophospholipase L1-like esterase